VPGAIADWLQHRTGYRDVTRAMLLEHVPGGARWRYVWGSTLVFVFSLQMITGLLLMTAYSPSDTNAWASVHFIQYQMDFGWLIRGLHHFGSQTMMVLMALHMLQVVLAGAQLPPREFNWWLGMGLLAITFGLGLTGYLLPWDQKGYWATRVATNIASNIPFAGDFIKQIVVGGPDYGNATLTRFYALHVGVLPLALIGCLIVHIALFRRHGVTHPVGAETVVYFWPGQVFKDLVACLLVFAVMLAAVLGVFGKHGNEVTDPNRPALNEQSLYDRWARAGQLGLGANLDAPADRDTADYPARPEWYFLFLFQLLKYFEGDKILVGTLYIPNGILLLLMLLPLFGFGRMRPFGYWFGVLVMVALLAGAIVLTALAFASDSEQWAPKAVEYLGGAETERQEAAKNAREFEEKVRHAHHLAARAAQLAMAGVPDDGARQLLRHDPMTKGQELFASKCATCHSFTPPAGGDFAGAIATEFKAGDLGNFGSEQWIRGLLDNPSDPKYFGRTSLKGMKRWKDGILKDRKRMDKQAIADEEAEFSLIAKWLPDQENKELEPKARPLFDTHCGGCHNVGSGGGEDGPDLTNYGTAQWLRGMIMAPGHKTRYGDKNRMPAFRSLEGPGSEIEMQEFFDSNPEFPKDQVLPLSDVQRELIIRFMRRDGRVVFGGRVIAEQK
jgi:quinol-cytochrome oxidoreductase complex cytochrome b subunit